MELTQTEKDLIAILKSCQISKRAVFSISTMMYSEDMQLSMMKFIMEHPQASEGQMLRFARLILEVVGEAESQE